MAARSGGFLYHALLALAVGGCGGRATAGESERAYEPTACEGAYGFEIVNLQTDLPDGRLHADGAHLVLIEPYGRILRIDRCTGEAVELTTFPGSVSHSATAGGYVWFVGRTDGVTPALFRLPLGGGELRRVGDIRPFELVANGATLYFTVLSEATETPAGRVLDVFSFSSDETEPGHVATLEHPPGAYLRIEAAGDAGLYFTLDYDCGCRPALERLPFGESDLVAVEGLGQSPGHGGYSVAASGDRLYVLMNGGSRSGELLRLPLMGGTPEVVGMAGGQNPYLLQARNRGLCWLAHESADIPQLILRCLPLGDPQSRERALVVSQSLSFSYALADDAVYWLQPAPDGAAYDLFAAAL